MPSWFENLNLNLILYTDTYTLAIKKVAFSLHCPDFLCSHLHHFPLKPCCQEPFWCGPVYARSKCKDAIINDRQNEKKGRETEEREIPKTNQGMMLLRISEGKETWSEFRGCEAPRLPRSKGALAEYFATSSCYTCGIHCYSSRELRRGRRRFSG